MVCDSDCQCLAVVAEAAETVCEAFCKYGTTGVAVSFNGGKDCTAVLDLACRLNPVPDIPLPMLCIDVPGESIFPEVEESISLAVARYPVKLFRYHMSLRDGLDSFLRENPSIQAIFIGVRRIDPKSESLKIFQATDPGWPAHMRIHPILNWPYDAVWHYLMRPPNLACCVQNGCIHDEQRHGNNDSVAFEHYGSLDDAISTERRIAICSALDKCSNIPEFCGPKPVPYCSLYDNGYTSIGSVENTAPNPYLLTHDCDHQQTDTISQYLPARMLSDPLTERAGRIRKPK